MIELVGAGRELFDPLARFFALLAKARGEVVADPELAFTPFDPGADTFEGGVGNFAAANVLTREVEAGFFNRGQGGGVFGVTAPGRHSLQRLPGGGEALFSPPQRRADFLQPVFSSVHRVFDQAGAAR